MKRGIVILLSVCTMLVVGYFTASKWAIRHETLTFHDAARNNRLVAVDIAVRYDKELQANAGMIKLPVAILNHGNTAEFRVLVSSQRLRARVWRSALSMICPPIRRW